MYEIYSKYTHMHMNYGGKKVLLLCEKEYSIRSR